MLFLAARLYVTTIRNASSAMCTLLHRVRHRHHPPCPHLSFERRHPDRVLRRRRCVFRISLLRLGQKEQREEDASTTTAKGVNVWKTRIMHQLYVYVYTHVFVYV